MCRRSRRRATPAAEMTTWYGCTSRRGTPKPIVTRSRRVDRVAQAARRWRGSGPGRRAGQREPRRVREYVSRRIRALRQAHQGKQTSRSTNEIAASHRALLLGDPAGIGPELAVKAALAKHELQREPTSSSTPHRDGAVDASAWPARNSRSPATARARRAARGCARCRGCASQRSRPAPPGGRRTASRSQRSPLRPSFRERRTHRRHRASPRSTSPRCGSGGMHHADELRYLQSFSIVSGFLSEFNVTLELWTSRVTSHIPLKDVAAACSRAKASRRPSHFVARSASRRGNASTAHRRLRLSTRTTATAARSAARRSTSSRPPSRSRARACRPASKGPLPADTVFVRRAPAATTTPSCRCITTRARSR